MNEEFLHYIFQHKLWSNNETILTDGRKFEIVEIGQHNFNSGPDFINSKIKIQNTLWIGNIEIHVKSSDWLLHKHQSDKAYNNTILHIVFTNDIQIKYQDSTEIPTWEIKFDHAMYNNYTKLQNSYKEINCENYINLVENEKLSLFLEKLATERLEEKTKIIADKLSKTNGDWEKTLYIILAKNFGFSTNSIPFEIMAEQTDINIVRKYKDDLFSLEALFFGQAGLLEEKNNDEYYNRLQREYNFLKTKYNIQAIPTEMWKKSRMRPSNFPHIKIAQFAAIMTKFDELFENIRNFQNNEVLIDFFKVSVSDYWETHYDFGKTAKKISTKLGQIAIDSIIINTIAPFLYFFNQNYQFNNENNVYLDILLKIKPENNIDIKKWNKITIKARNAFESQALIHLLRNYCQSNKCMECNIGYEILNKIRKIEEKIN